MTLTLSLLWKLEIEADGSDFTKISTTGSHTKLINADANDTAGEIDPGDNGWTLITWSKKTSDNQYVRITFSDDNGTAQNFSEDLVIGSIQYGEYIDFPSVDMNITTSIDYEGVKLQRSLGGNVYSSMTSMGAPTWDSTNPFNTATTANEQTYTFKRRHGRVRHSMTMSHITDTTLWASAMQGVQASKFYDAETLHSNFYNKVMGQHLPFLFTIDSTSTEEGTTVCSDLTTPRLVHSKHSIECGQLKWTWLKIGRVWPGRWFGVTLLPHDRPMGQLKSV